MPRASVPFFIFLFARCFAFQAPPAPAANHLADPFAVGWMLVDTNGDGIADFINGKVVVPAAPTAVENAAAANIAARLGYGTTGLTPPLVVTADPGGGPRIVIGKATDGLVPGGFEKEEGGIFLAGDGLLIAAGDDAGLQAAAEAYSARAPYQWRVSGETLSAIAEAAGGELIGVSYQKGKAGVHRAFLRGATGALDAAIASPKLASVHQLVVIGGLTATNSRPEVAQPASAGAAPTTDTAGGAAAANAAPTRLDLATLFTSRGLFGASGRIPVPGSSNGHLFVPAGAAGVAMANLAARMGLETTGITLPIASPADTAAARDVRVPAVLAGQSPLSQEAERKLRATDTSAAQSETDLAPGEGELRVVDDAFTRRPAILARGDDRGAAAALGILADRFPNLWEQGKQYLSIEEIRYDLHRFFSLRSSAGQAAAALYHLDQWSKTLDTAGIRDLKAEIFTEVADPGLSAFVKQLPHLAGATVETASLHAGTKCCADGLHYQSAPFHQAAPTFTEDIVIPWEGKRLLDAVRRAAPKIAAGQDVKLVARVSEGPEERRKLAAQLQDILRRRSRLAWKCCAPTSRAIAG